jgi:quercetin dioxygenase-like cupin family protein
VNRWHLPSLGSSSEKRRAREPGAGAPRVASLGRQMPRVLFSSPECRVVVIDLQSGEELGDRQVRERAVLEVVTGRASIECTGETVECETGTLVTFDPGEQHSVRALADERLLLVLAPWLAARTSTEAEVAHARHLPANASADPVESSDPAGSRPG